MKKLPKIRQFELTKNIHNNKKIFDSLKDNNIAKSSVDEAYMKDEEKDNLSVDKKIKQLLTNSTYIFNTEVTLVFTDREKKCNIAGIVNNHIITMDNEIIKINDLKDIKF